MSCGRIVKLAMTDASLGVKERKRLTHRNLQSASAAIESIHSSLATPFAFNWVSWCLLAP